MVSSATVHEHRSTTLTAAVAPAELAELRKVVIPARAVRWVTIGSAVLGCVFTGWQTSRAVDGQPWAKELAIGALVGAVFAALGILLWTWVVMENARRLLSIARSEHPVMPGLAVAAWFPPMIIGVGAAASVVYLQARLHEPSDADSSPVPLAVAGLALVVMLLFTYRPLFILSGVTRRLGGGSVELARMFWAPVALLVVGSVSLVVLRVSGTYGPDFEGLAPAWALGAVAIPPTVIVLVLAWRGGTAMEDALDNAYDRRHGAITAGFGRTRAGLLTRALRADLAPPVRHDVRKRIRLLPGSTATRLAVVTALAALALLSIVGSIVMFLFWREANDGGLLQTQEARAWDALDALRRLERLFALGLLAITSLWAFVNVTNARLASGRRRNPLLAAAAWPAAAYAIWRVADRVGDDERIVMIVGGFAVQAAILYVPFFLLERSASAVGAMRQPLRMTYGLGVILLVQTQGLAGLSTVDTATATSQFGRLAGYLTLTALVGLLATLSITESSRLIGDAARHEADRHNMLVEQRRQLEERLSAKPPPPAAPQHAPLAPLAGTEPTASLPVPPPRLRSPREQLPGAIADRTASIGMTDRADGRGAGGGVTPTT